MISINNIYCSYNKSQNVLNNLCLTLSLGNIHGVVGLNGAGKTTFLNSLYGIVKPNSGTILYNQSQLSKKNIAYLVTELFFYPNINGYEYLSLINNKSFNTDSWNQLFELPLNKIIDTYSTGMKKKLALLGILKQNKPIIILDEPFNGLDLETAWIIQNVLVQLKKKNHTIIVTSHIIETLTNICDQIHYLESGIINYSVCKEDFAKFEQEMILKFKDKNQELILNLVDGIK